MSRRHVVYGMSNAGFVAPVSRHWTAGAAWRAWQVYTHNHRHDWSFHVIDRKMLSAPSHV